VLRVQAILEQLTCQLVALDRQCTYQCKPELKICDSSLHQVKDIIEIESLLH